MGFKQATYQAAWWGAILGCSHCSLRDSWPGYGDIRTGYPSYKYLSFLCGDREKSLATFHFIRHLAQKKKELVKAGVLPGEPLVSFASVRIGDLIKSFVPQRFHVILLLDENWQHRGVVSEAQVIDALMNQGVDTPVGNLVKAWLVGQIIVRLNFCRYF